MTGGLFGATFFQKDKNKQTEILSLLTIFDHQKNSSFIHFFFIWYWSFEEFVSIVKLNIHVLFATNTTQSDMKALVIHQLLNTNGNYTIVTKAKGFIIYPWPKNINSEIG